jgi:hypothetical protein
MAWAIFYRSKSDLVLQLLSLEFYRNVFEIFVKRNGNRREMNREENSERHDVIT